MAFLLCQTGPVLATPGDEILLKAQPQASHDYTQRLDGCNFGREDDMEIREALRGLCKDSIEHLRARTQYNKSVHDYNKTMYQRHQFWTEIAAVAVYILTFAGLTLAFMQFLGVRQHSREKRLPNPSAETALSESGASPDNGRHANLQTGLKLGNLAEINSNVIGLIILVISLAFFFLYLKEVYPIKEPASDSGQSKAPEALYEIK